jgi:hypothetical protein
MTTVSVPSYVDGSPSDGHRAPSLIRYANANTTQRRLIRVTLASTLLALKDNRHLADVLAPDFALVLIDVPDPREPERSTLPDRVVVGLDESGKVSRGRRGLPRGVRSCVRAILNDADRFKSLQSRWLAQSLQAARASSCLGIPGDGRPAQFGPGTAAVTTDSEPLQCVGPLVHPDAHGTTISPTEGIGT